MKKEILAMSNKKKKKEPLSREQICRSSRFRKDTDTPNPFDEEVPVKKAYAIYLSPEQLIEYRVIKTYNHPLNETEESKWLVARKNMLIGLPEGYDLVELTREDVKYKSFMVSCSDNWKQYHAN